MGGSSRGSSIQPNNCASMGTTRGVFSFPTVIESKTAIRPGTVLGVKEGLVDNMMGALVSSGSDMRMGEVVIGVLAGGGLR